MSDHAGPRSLRRLLGAVLSIGSDLELHATLRHITEAAVALVDARYGALGVLNESRTGLAEFVTVGIDDETYAAIGSLPKGLGLIGSLITNAEPLRLADLREHPDSAGFPPNHPAMRSFLGVPIRVRDEVFGNLYLTDKTSGEVFTDVDEELVLGLATAAGVAIENARLYEHVRRREAALEAMTEVATALLAGTASHESLQLVAEHARELVDASLATISLPEPNGTALTIEVAVGDDGPELLGRRFARAGSVAGDVLASGGVAVLDDASHDYRVEQPEVRDGSFGPMVFVPLRSAGEPFGALAVARPTGTPQFLSEEVELVQSFAAQASVVLEHDRRRQQAERLTVLEDQERIARDLHDTVIQRLFACGLSLQGALRLVSDPDAERRVAAAIEDLDVTVRHIRTVIFDIGSSIQVREESVRSRVLDVTREAARVLGFEPTVRFDGPVDAVVPPYIADELTVILREALSNIARHAYATSVDVEIRVGDELLLRVTDNGVGIPEGADHSGGHGLRNMSKRAERLRGRMEVSSGAQGGARLEWVIPIADA